MKMEKSAGGKALKIVGIVLLVLLLLILLVVLAVYGYYHSKVSMLQPDETRAPEATLSASEEEELNKDGKDLNDEMENILSGMETMDPVEPTEPEGGIREDEQVVNILLIGTDERTEGFSQNARGDSCLLLSINHSGDHPVVSLVSFERGMGVPILEGQYQGQWDWLTHTFRYGGADLMLKEIRHCFNVDVDYYVRVNFTSFETGIDLVGGVDVEMDAAEAAYFNAIGCPVVVGTNHLDGEWALSYARLREIDSDWVRIQRQREVIFSAFSQLKGMSLTEADQLINNLIPLVRTNLTEDMITQLLLMLPKLPSATFQQMTIPVKGTYGGMTGMGGRGLFAVDFQANAEILHDFIYGTDEG